MLYDIYCDESRQDLLVNKAAITENNRYCCIGGLMLLQSERENLKQEIKRLKVLMEVNSEFKWSTVSPNKIDFYIEIIDLFFKYSALSFRTVVIDASCIDNSLYNNGDHELGYYKFYYQLLQHWIDSNHCYYVFTDNKTNKERNRLSELKRIVNISNNDSIKIMQALDSKESLLLQMQNIILGAICYKFNYDNGGTSSAKQAVVNRIEYHIGHVIQPTNKECQKLNIFKMDLKRGLH